MQLITPAAILLDEVARSGSIRRAAERLHISASAVNRQILNLEEEIGLPLFERLPRGVRPTAAGERLLADIRRWRREQARAQGVLKDIAGARRGSVSLGAMECFSDTILPAALSGFRAAHPLVAVDVVLGTTDDLLRRLMLNELDMVLCFNPPPRYQAEGVLARQFIPGVAMDPAHPLAARPRLRITDLDGWPLVLPDTSLALRALVDAALDRAGLAPPVVTSTNSTGLMKSLLRGSDCLAILSGLDVAEEVAAGRLTFRLLDGAGIEPEALVLCVRRKQRPTASAQAMIATLRAALPPGWPGGAP